jgi:predicted secreted protein
MQLLENICVSEAEISSCTSDRESLEETKRKQNIRESLTKIFNFGYTISSNIMNFSSSTR